eukprot:5208243-Amphidinium_carterae.2
MCRRGAVIQEGGVNETTSTGIPAKRRFHEVQGVIVFDRCTLYRRYCIVDVIEYKLQNSIVWERSLASLQRHVPVRCKGCMRLLVMTHPSPRYRFAAEARC